MNISPLIAGTMKWGSWGARFSSADYQSMIHKCIDTGITTFSSFFLLNLYPIKNSI